MPIRVFSSLGNRRIGFLAPDLFNRHDIRHWFVVGAARISLHKKLGNGNQGWVTGPKEILDPAHKSWIRQMSLSQV